MGGQDRFFKRFPDGVTADIEGKKFKLVRADFADRERRCTGCDLLNDHNRCFHAGETCTLNRGVWKEVK